jgi:hypothetical protein
MSGILGNEKGRETKQKVEVVHQPNPLTGHGVSQPRMSSKGAAKTHNSSLGNLATYMGENNEPLKSARRRCNASALSGSKGEEEPKPKKNCNTSQLKSTIDTNDSENSFSKKQVSQFEQGGRTKMHGSNILGKNVFVTRFL